LVGTARHVHLSEWTHVMCEHVSTQVALRLARLLTADGRKVDSVIRQADQSQGIEDVGANPVVLSLEDNSVDDFVPHLEVADVVVFAAGAGGVGGEARTKAVDYEGALKIFDAIEKTNKKPRLIAISAIDVRDTNKPPPAHYDERDIAISERIRKSIGPYMHWKYECDKQLIKRTAFKWTILRPGGLVLNPGAGTASIGRTHLTTVISRDDVAKVLQQLVDRPEAAGLAIDIVGGSEPLEDALDAMIKRGDTDFEG